MDKSRTESIIKDQILRLEREEHVSVLFACESGSRAWGFESVDSDWDVRFIYARRPDDYLSIEQMRDVIERMLPNDLDLAGWDLRKALQLLRKSNPSLIEWLRSPIVYHANDEFLSDLREVADACVSMERLFHHYLSMAKGNFMGYLQGEEVSAKKYLYVLRPILACRWIEFQATPPPVEFDCLVEGVMPAGPGLTQLQQLLDRKKSGVEMGRGPVIPELHEFIGAELERLPTAKPKPRINPPPDPLNDLFRKWIHRP